MAFSRDGTKLVSAGDDATVRDWDVASRRAIGSPMRGHAGTITAVTFSPGGDLVASAGSDGTVRLWDPQRRRQSGSPPRGHAGPVHAVAFSPDGLVIASGGIDQTARLWSVATHRQSGEPLRATRPPLTSGVSSPLYVAAVAFSPDGRTLASADVVAIRLWDGATHNAVGPPLRGAGNLALAFSADGRTLAGQGVADRSVKLFDVAGASAAPTLLLARQPLDALSPGVTDAAFSADVKTRVSAGADGRMRLWTVARNAPIGAPIGPAGMSLTGVAMSSDGRLLASAGDDGTVRLLDVATRRQLGAPLHSGDEPVLCVAFSPDGKTLAAGGDDHLVRLWDVASGRPLGSPLRGHVDAIDAEALVDSILWRGDDAARQARICAVTRRDLSRAEWRELRPDTPYRRTCSHP